MSRLIGRKRGADDVPEGQPRAYPRTKLSGKYPTFVYPHQIVRVRSKEELESALEHYSHPFPMMDGAPFPKNPAAYRRVIEWVYPALRWFCRVYGHPVPKWLEKHGHINGMSDKDFERNFGKGKLKIVEFKEDKSKAGERT